MTVAEGFRGLRPTVMSRPCDEASNRPFDWPQFGFDGCSEGIGQVWLQFLGIGVTRPTIATFGRLAEPCKVGRVVRISHPPPRRGTA